MPTLLAELVAASHAVAGTSSRTAKVAILAGLLQTLDRDELLDLLAYVQAEGDPQHPNFQPAP